MFGSEIRAKFNQFRAVVRASFANVKQDVDELKKSVTEWILFLDGNQRNLKMRISKLEREVEELKRRKELVEVY